jgi:uncharacterized protein with GYD domain|tara:strand:- start:10 stop:333 length:324 start_codon:yes stop_codon:yes gene_type:complete
MARFFVLGNYSEESFQALIDNPDQDRRAAVQELMEAMGCKMLRMEFLRGSVDFIIEVEASSFEDIAAIKMAVEAQGAGTVDAFEVLDLNAIAKKAGVASSKYTPPSS